MTILNYLCHTDQIEVTVEVHPQDEADTEVSSSGKEEPTNTKGECNALFRSPELQWCVQSLGVHF